MKILRAEHMGMCFGVRDAISMALSYAKMNPITILGELVHNQTVLNQLRNQGIQIEQRLEDVKSQTVMITAHGASQKSIQTVRERNFRVVEATCPLVRLAHQSLTRLVSEGYYPVIIGKVDHVEVRGMTEDLTEYSVILQPEHFDSVPDHPRLGVVGQTTQPIDKVRQLVALLQKRFPQSEVRFIDTVCMPTKQRQASAIEISQQSDVVVVIGGPQSNNTRELAATCARYCSQVHQIASVDELKPEWFLHAETVGITAGTSTPDTIIEAVEKWLKALAVENHHLMPA